MIGKMVVEVIIIMVVVVVVGDTVLLMVKKGCNIITGIKFWKNYRGFLVKKFFKKNPFLKNFFVILKF